MSHDNETEIICPYCDKQAVEEAWEYDGYARMQCGSCEEEFRLEVDHTTTYSTFKKNCKDDKHNFGEAKIYYDSTDIFDRSYKYIEKKLK